MALGLAVEVPDQVAELELELAVAPAVLLMLVVAELSDRSVGFHMNVVAVTD